ncbi:hypothetical protein [Antarcticimicrobium sediminis]|uniref:Uncharacterized protein n=1 Tax=Antarcticimicrobium sediminis TaxID=2546227 RepID=A0A4R5ERQ3_9RHOB|nr:hypothetical protein [Antarcticimicrobium sediminis]TDE37489.1 hypothetical protein E1B25_12265 [Antarcticimicrobium sediminis]
MSLSLPALSAAAALVLTCWGAAPDRPGAPLHLTGGDAVGSSPVFVPYGAGKSSPSGSSRPTDETPSEATTAQVVATLQQATRYCSWLKRDGKGEFVVDCLAERLDDVNRRMAGTGGYEEVRAVLEQTTRDLHRIARDNRAAGQRATRFRTQDADGKVTRTNRALVPVDPARQQAAVAQALAVIAEAETRLLRSASDGTASGAQFQRIAAAVGSNKVLLRSL